MRDEVKGIKSTHANRILVAFASIFLFSILWLLIAEVVSWELGGIGLRLYIGLVGLSVLAIDRAFVFLSNRKRYRL